MHALLISTMVVALAEIGDKTQLLALVLAARFRRPWPIIAGILIATLANHGIAAALGSWISTHITPHALQWLVAASFFAMAVWMLIPDKEDDASVRVGYGAFLTTLIVFFLVEIGDKTQVATVVLAVRYDPITAVVAGSTLGMLAANVPAVLLGGLAGARLPVRLINGLAALVFLGLAIAVVMNGAQALAGPGR